MKAAFAPGSDRSVGEVLSDIGGNFERLFRAEIRLAGAEAATFARSTARSVVLIIATVLFALCTVMLLLAGAVAALVTRPMPVWSAALLVAAGTAVLSIILALVARTAIRRVSSPGEILSHAQGEPTHG